MSRAKSRLTVSVTWGQIQEIAQRCHVQGLPANGDRLPCHKKKLPIGGRQIRFMLLTRGRVQGTVIVLAELAAPTKSLRRINFTKNEAPELFIKAAETVAKLKRFGEEAEDEGGVRQLAGQKSPHSEPAPFAARTVVAVRRKPKPNRRSSRVRFRASRGRIAG